MIILVFGDQPKSAFVASVYKSGNAFSLISLFFQACLTPAKQVAPFLVTSIFTVTFL